MYNQDRLAELFYARRDSLDAIPEVRFRNHVLADPSGFDLVARAALYQGVGDGDIALGKQRLTVPAFLNGVYMDAAGNLPDIGIGDTLVLPDHYDLDFRAYAPFPRHWAGAAGFDKMFVIHKGVQAWAAYRNGDLDRWGLVSTGKDESETPNGRFNFNWKELHRVSTLSPPGPVVGHALGLRLLRRARHPRPPVLRAADERRREPRLRPPDDGRRAVDLRLGRRLGDLQRHGRPRARQPRPHHPPGHDRPRPRRAGVGRPAALPPDGDRPGAHPRRRFPPTRTRSRRAARSRSSSTAPAAPRGRTRSAASLLLRRRRCLRIGGVARSGACVFIRTAPPARVPA